MKSVSRASIWWPGIDADVEAYINGCHACQVSNPKFTSKVLHSWPITTYPYERVHIDFFQFDYTKFILIFDTYSKWIDVLKMRNTDAISTITVLRRNFSIFALPKTLVFDNVH